MSQVDNLQILIDTLQNVKQEEIKREQDQEIFHSRISYLEAETERQRRFIQQLYSLTQSYIDNTL